MLKDMYAMEKAGNYDIDRCFLCGIEIPVHWARLGFCNLDGRFRSIHLDHEGTDAYKKLVEEIHVYRRKGV